MLLYKRCHIDGPNVTDPEIMWDWIKAYSVPFYDMFWGVLGAKEYQFIYKKSVAQEVRDILEAANAPYDETTEAKLKELRQEAEESAGIHFGHPYYNTATIAGMNRMILKNLAKYYNVPFPLEDKCTDKPKTAWWLQDS